MLSKGFALPSSMSLLPLRGRRRVAAAAALLAVAGLAATAPASHARPYHQVGLGTAGFPQHDNFALQLNEGGAGYMSMFWDPSWGSARGDINIGGGRSVYAVGVAAGVRYEVP